MGNVQQNFQYLHYAYENVHLLYPRLDSSTNNIGVADLSGEYQTILPLHNNTQIRAFAISPKHNTLYFAEGSSRLIYKLVVSFEVFEVF